MSNKRDGWRIAGLIFGSLLTLGMVLVVVDEGVRIYRGWRNTNGTAVSSFGIYEKGYTSPVVEETMQKIREKFPPVLRMYNPRAWELIDSYQWEMLCRIDVANKQRVWTAERERILARPGTDGNGRPLFTESDLPVERYRCQPMKMLYRSGQGWGLF